MKDAKTLRSEWDKSPHKAEWATILQTQAWAMVSELVRLEMVEKATPSTVIEHDAIVARRLVRQNGGTAALQKLQNASNPQAQPPPEPLDCWEYIDPNKPTT